MKKILLSHPLYKVGMDALEGKAELIIPGNGDSDEILEQLKQADGFILRIGKIDAKAIEACPKLRVITRPGVGVDNVDVKAATAHGIPVVICPASNSRAVAEHALALMFALGKNLLESDQETRKGNFGVRNKYAAVELGGKKVSILGLGHIGRELGKMCQGIGMEVLAYDPYVTREAVEALGYTYCGELEDALQQGDYISLHMPSLPSTKGLIDRSALEQMKKSAFLINCARGDIVEEEALYWALTSGEIAGAGLDVLQKEPMPADHPLMGLTNVIVTPHMAAQTQETTGKTVLMAVEGTLAVLDGKKWPNVANPEVYEHARFK